MLQPARSRHHGARSNGETAGEERRVTMMPAPVRLRARPQGAVSQTEGTCDWPDRWWGCSSPRRSGCSGDVAAAGSTCRATSHTQTEGQQLMDLKKALDARAISKDEYDRMRVRIIIEGR